MRADSIPTSVTKRQTDASDPEVSAWVAANAGSGKTHVLAQRVIRLLLSGVQPARILCITFTKAAAANMANRVFERLAAWTTLDNAALDKEMKRIGVRGIDDELRTRARQLFALTLETPGGLKVQTIHAFCTHLLHMFPFEAKVAARFTVLDEAAERQLLEKISLDVLLDAAKQPEAPLGRALATAIAAAADVTFRDVLNEAIGERDKLARWIAAAGGVEQAIAQLSKALGIAADDTLARVETDLMRSPHLPISEWDSVAKLCAASSSNDQKQSERMKMAAAATGEDRLDAYLSVFFTDKNDPRKSIITAALAKKHPDLAQRLEKEQQRAGKLRERRNAIAVRERTRALVTIADEVLKRFQTEKDRRGLLDYDDLIDKTNAMLSNTAAAWVHYKLDRGIDHVLIDEAQDTSPKQWAIIRALVAEFFAGAGAQTQRRTIFAVGDEKQSIFSFQGAAPREFEAMRREFDRLSKAVDHAFRGVNLDYSFRSGANVLEAVDIVFQANDTYLSIVSERDAYLRHAALPDAAPGLVEIWDTEKPADRREIEAWDAPFDTVTETSPLVRLAERIASAMKSWQRQGTRSGDVLILVRRRGPLFEAIIRALKLAGIAVAGADRLVLTEHIAVMDLIALADALLLPQDDLALAAVLKSPLFGFDDEHLIALAIDRKGTLREALAVKAREKPQFAEALAKLERLDHMVRRETPFSFYASLLNAERGRQQFEARLGPEAADALDEFLNLALEYERNETPTLQGFVAWLRAAKSEIKRDMDMVRDEVRVMTVHGAKGLEARTVILADTTTPPQGWHPPKLLALPDEQAAPGAAERLVWVGPTNADIGPMSTARQRAQAAARDEYRRLLYVAMTRASERLIICGVDGERKRPDGCWYDLVHGALTPLPSTIEELDENGRKVWRYRKAADASATEISNAQEKSKVITLPAWLMRDVPVQPISQRIRPSGSVEDAPRAEADESRRAALERGTLVHRLLQSLPDVTREQRAAVANRFLTRKGTKFNAAERETIARQVLAILDDARYAQLFAPGSSAELSISGRLDSGAIAGQIDRLIVSDDEILIADYKTNRPAPRTLAEALERHGAYVRQLALYRAVLMRIYPGRPVRATLVWTEGPELMEIPAESLDSALAENTSS